MDKFKNKDRSWKSEMAKLKEEIYALDDANKALIGQNEEKDQLNMQLE